MIGTWIREQKRGEWGGKRRKGGGKGACVIKSIAKGLFPKQIKYQLFV
jgi:hypothetical protein